MKHLWTVTKCWKGDKWIANTYETESWIAFLDWLKGLDLGAYTFDHLTITRQAVSESQRCPTCGKP